jgi:acetolactate synthase-1/2/3 large subunit
MTPTLAGRAARNGVNDAAVTRETISGGHLVAKALKAEGVDTIYTLCGGHIIDIYDGCVDKGIAVVDVRHKQVAAHAADGHARITGKPGCAVVTAGPGTSDAITGVANALRAQSPMLLIGGQGALDQHKMGSLQDLPHVDMITPITKFAATVPHTARAADMVSMAFRECFNGAPGPSFLEIPRALRAGPPPQAGGIPRVHALRGRPGRRRAAGRPHRAVREAVRPAGQPGVDVPGYGRSHRVRPHAQRPGVHERRGPRHPHAHGPAAFPAGPLSRLQRGRPRHHRRHAVRLPDGLWPAAHPDGQGRADRPRLPHGRQEPRHRPRIVGDVGAVLAAATAVSSGRISSGAAGRKAWIDELRAFETAAYEKRLRRQHSDASPIDPYRLVHEINEFLTEDSIYVGDGGDIVTFSGQVVQPKSPGHWMDLGPLGTLGAGIPFVMAAKHARPDKEIVALFGDGAFSLTGWDFESLVRFNLPFVGIVGNNSSMNQIRYGQIQKYGEGRGRVGNSLGHVKYDQFATMLGGYGEEVSDPADIAPALQRARESGLPSLINVWVDPEVYAPGTMNQTMYK